MLEEPIPRQTTVEMDAGSGSRWSCVCAELCIIYGAFLNFVAIYFDHVRSGSYNRAVSKLSTFNECRD